MNIKANRWSVLVVVIVVFASGCATTSTSDNTDALDLQPGPTRLIDEYVYSTLTVLPFSVGADAKEAGEDFGERFAGDIVAQLKSDFPNTFEKVRWKIPKHEKGEVILTGNISEYKRGSVLARSILIGLGSSSFEGNMILKDAVTGKVIASASFDEFWAWGGGLGASKSIDNMVGEISVAIAKSVALWKQNKLAGEN